MLGTKWCWSAVMRPFLALVLLPGFVALGWGQMPVPVFEEQSSIPGLASLEMVDQFDQRHVVLFPADRPLVLAIYQKFSKKQLPGWLDPIDAEFGDRARILCVADLSDFPPRMRPLLQKIFLDDRRAASVMDFSGEFGRLVPAAKPDKMGLLVIGKDGRILFRETGAATEEKLRVASQWINADLGNPALPMASVSPPPLPPESPSIPSNMTPSSSPLAADSKQPPLAADSMSPPLAADSMPPSAPPAIAAASPEPPPAAPTSPVAMSPGSPAPALSPPLPPVEPAPLLPKVDVRALSSVTMTDQFDQKHRLAFPEERPVLITANGRNGQEQITQWLEPLKAEFDGRVRLVSVADIRGLPSFMRGSMKEKFRKSLAQPVIMDFSGEVVGLLPSDPQNMTLTVLDRAGNVIFAGSGPPTERQMRELSQALRNAIGGVGASAPALGAGEVN